MNRRTFLQTTGLLTISPLLFAKKEKYIIHLFDENHYKTELVAESIERLENHVKEFYETNFTQRFVKIEIVKSRDYSYTYLKIHTISKDGDPQIIFTPLKGVDNE